jgi:DNA-binding transcriptional ArsR family regulator
MRKQILKRVKEGTSGQMLELLRRSPMTVDELAAALGVTRTAIRAQLATL